MTVGLQVRVPGRWDDKDNVLTVGLGHQSVPETPLYLSFKPARLQTWNLHHQLSWAQGLLTIDCGTSQLLIMWANFYNKSFYVNTCSIGCISLRTLTNTVLNLCALNKQKPLTELSEGPTSAVPPLPPSASWYRYIRNTSHLTLTFSSLRIHNFLVTQELYFK